MKQQNDDLETDDSISVEENHFDATILYSPLDYAKAKHYLDLMQSLRLQNNNFPKVCLYDHPKFTPEACKTPREIIQSCTFIFCLYTENTRDDRFIEFIKEEAIGLTRLAEEETSSCPGLLERRYCVRPLIDGKLDTLPAGLTTIRPIDMADKTNATRHLKDLFNTYWYLRKIREESARNKNVTHEKYMRQQPSDGVSSSKTYLDKSDYKKNLTPHQSQENRLSTDLCVDYPGDCPQGFAEEMPGNEMQNNTLRRKRLGGVIHSTDASLVEGNTSEDKEVKKQTTEHQQIVYLTNCNYVQLGNAGNWNVQSFSHELDIKPTDECDMDGNNSEDTVDSDYEYNIYHDSGIPYDINQRQNTHEENTNGAYTVDQTSDRLLSHRQGTVVPDDEVSKSHNMNNILSASVSFLRSSQKKSTFLHVSSLLNLKSHSFIGSDSNEDDVH